METRTTAEADAVYQTGRHDFPEPGSLGSKLVPAMVGMILCAVLGFPALAVVPPIIGAVASGRKLEKAALFGHVGLAVAATLLILIRWSVFGVPLL